MDINALFEMYIVTLHKTFVLVHETCYIYGHS